MAVRLVDSIQKEMDVKFNQRTFYTDSRTVLTWRQSEPRQYRPYVAFRLGEIEELSEASKWQWIKSVDNPADDATRDVVADLNADSRWLKGPDFLRYKVLQSATRTESGEYAGQEEEVCSLPMVNYVQLPELHERVFTNPRNIWQEDTRNLEINDVVLLVAHSYPVIHG